MSKKILLIIILLLLMRYVPTYGNYMVDIQVEIINKKTEERNIQNGLNVTYDSYGKISNKQKKLIYCIPISNRKYFYSEHTLGWIFRLMKPNEDIQFIAFIVDSDYGKAQRLRDLYNKQMEQGLFSIVVSHKQNYDEFKLETLNSRTAWYSKMNHDFAYFMTYCKNMAENCIWLEDDVYPDIHFNNEVINLINEFYSTKQFSFLSFCNLGTVAILPNRGYYDQMIKYYRTRALEKPTDWLMEDYANLHGRPLIYTKVLFNHYGYSSSYKEKIQELRSHSVNPSLLAALVLSCRFYIESTTFTDCINDIKSKTNYNIKNQSKFIVEFVKPTVLERVFIFVKGPEKIFSTVEAYGQNETLLFNFIYDDVVEIFPYVYSPVKSMTIRFNACESLTTISMEFLRWFALD